jgi:hypothetical protein
MSSARFSSPLPCSTRLARYPIHVASHAEAQAIQTFLWCLWLIALNGRTIDGQLSRATVGGVISVNHGYATDGLARINRINIVSAVGRNACGSDARKCNSISFLSN